MLKRHKRNNIDIDVSYVLTKIIYRLKATLIIEISKITIGVLIAGLLSLLSISIVTVFKTNQKLSKEYDSRQDYLEDENTKLIAFNQSIENIKNIPEESLCRIRVLKDSVPFTQNTFFSKIQINNYLTLSSNSRFEIQKSIGVVDEQSEILNFYVANAEINKTLIGLLNSEIKIWESVDKYLLMIRKDNWSENELLFKKIDYNLLNYFDWKNKHSSEFVKIINSKENIQQLRDRKNRNFESSIKHLKSIILISMIGVFISLIIFIAILAITGKEIINR